MAKRDDLILGNISFGPVRQPGAPDIVVHKTASKLAIVPPTVRCQVSACPSNKEGRCTSSAPLSIGLDGVCQSAKLVFTKASP